MLVGGESVVVKIQRPGLDDLLRRDATVLRLAARVAERRVAGAGDLGIRELADDFWAAVARFLVDVRGTKRWPAIEARFAQMYEYTKRDESGTYR